MRMIIPPNGFIGSASQTQATQRLFSRSMPGTTRTNGGGKRRRKKAAASPKRAGKRKLKFGSPAWRAKYLRKKKRK